MMMSEIFMFWEQREMQDEFNSSNMEENIHKYREREERDVSERIYGSLSTKREPKSSQRSILFIILSVLR